MKHLILALTVLSTLPASAEPDTFQTADTAQVEEGAVPSANTEQVEEEGVTVKLRPLLRDFYHHAPSTAPKQHEATTFRKETNNYQRMKWPRIVTVVCGLLLVLGHTINFLIKVFKKLLKRHENKE